MSGSDMCEQVLLSRTRLRRAGQRNCVWSLLYIPPERSSGPKAALGQVCSFIHHPQTAALKCLAPTSALALVRVNNLRTTSVCMTPRVCSTAL